MLLVTPSCCVSLRTLVALRASPKTKQSGAAGTMLVEAKRIRRKRQILLVAALVMGSCAVVALADGIPLGRSRAGPAAPKRDYEA